MSCSVKIDGGGFYRVDEDFLGRVSAEGAVFGDCLPKKESSGCGSPPSHGVLLAGWRNDRLAFP